MTHKISDMSPNEIRIALLRKGVTQSGIARDQGVSAQMVYQVIERKNISHRICEAIGDAIGKDLKEIWPSIYLYGGGPRKPGRPSLITKQAG
jgi:lambda repressor-like predicted transcriptional regulator